MKKRTPDRPRSARRRGRRVSALPPDPFAAADAAAMPPTMAADGDSAPGQGMRDLPERIKAALLTLRENFEGMVDGNRPRRENLKKCLKLLDFFKGNQHGLVSEADSRSRTRAFIKSHTRTKTLRGIGGVVTMTCSGKELMEFLSPPPPKPLGMWFGLRRSNFPTIYTETEEPE